MAGCTTKEARPSADGCLVPFGLLPPGCLEPFASPYTSGIPPSPPPMVAEDEDVDMQEVHLPAPSDFRTVGIKMRESPSLFFGTVSDMLTPRRAKAIRRGAGKQLDDALAEIVKLKGRVCLLEKAADVADVDPARRIDNLTREVRSAMIQRKCADKKVRQAAHMKDEWKARGLRIAQLNTDVVEYRRRESDEGASVCAVHTREAADDARQEP